uniref:(northern house mosquito) hypothetical protein n=1 Tax=Culex pipiens TaxID=7175 RepID=A0A8D8DBV5_CULPI
MCTTRLPTNGTFRPPRATSRPVVLRTGSSWTAPASWCLAAWSSTASTRTSCTNCRRPSGSGRSFGQSHQSRDCHRVVVLGTASPSSATGSTCSVDSPTRVTIRRTTYPSI